MARMLEDYACEPFGIGLCARCGNAFRGELFGVLPLKPPILNQVIHGIEIECIGIILTRPGTGTSTSTRPGTGTAARPGPFTKWRQIAGRVLSTHDDPLILEPSDF